MLIRDVCPRCKSPKYKKNWHLHHGKQHYHGHDCGRQCVQCCEPYLIAEDKGGLIECLVVARLSFCGICRAVGVTLTWLLGCLVQCFEALPDHLHVQPVSCQHDVLIQCLEGEAGRQHVCCMNRPGVCNAMSLLACLIGNSATYWHH